MNSEFYTDVNRYGNNILYRGYAADGTRIEKKVKFKPKLFIPDKDGKYEWKSMSGESLKPVFFETMREMKDFQNMYNDVDGFKYYGFERHQYAFIQKKFPNEINYDRRLINVVNFDIETGIGTGGFPDPAIADQEVRTISAHCSRDDRMHVWGFKHYTPRSDKVVFHACVDEGDLLTKFIEWFSDDFYSPDVLTGWFIERFDIPYLVNRIIRLMGEDMAKQLSPWKFINRRKIKGNYGRDTEGYDIPGVQIMDYVELFKKFGAQTYGNQESYSLDHISWVVLGDKKIKYEGNLDTLYHDNFTKFVDYNIKDVDLVKRIDDQLGYLDIAFTLAYLGGVNYLDTLKTTPLWDSIIFRQLSRQHIAVPAPSNHFKAKFAGGYVKEPQVGMHDWVLSFDLNSLYPNIIVQHNMSPETLLAGVDNTVDHNDMVNGLYRNEKENTAVAANGARFDITTMGIIPSLVKEMYAGRVAIKKKMIEAQQEKELLERELLEIRQQLKSAIGNA